MKDKTPYSKIFIGDSRKMIELNDGEIDLIITSPPYWHIKNYGAPHQIGYGQTLHEYLKDLYRVWQECFRVLKPGRRLCINIGDQFARSIIYGRYKIIPLHAEIIAQCEDIGFDYMGSIIWQKKTTMNTTGGANVMGSYPFPPNGMVEIDYEFILIFKKPGKSTRIEKEIKEASRLSLEEWKQYFSGHWYFGGVRQEHHEAMFPDELPRRLIKMFSFVGETVLDPFIGSGTTAKVANQLNRNAIGYEINEDFVPLIRKKLATQYPLLDSQGKIDIVFRKQEIEPAPLTYKPAIQDAAPQIDPQKLNFQKNHLYRVTGIRNANTIILDTGLEVQFQGIKIIKEKETLRYLRDYVLKKEVFLKFENGNLNIPTQPNNDQPVIRAYVYLKNKIFVNAYLIRSGLAVTDTSQPFRQKNKFLELEHENK